MADLLFDFNIKKIATIFEEDSDLYNNAIMVLFPSNEYGDIYIDTINPLRTALYMQIAELLLADYDHISENTMSDLWDSNFLIIDFESIFGVVVTESVYKQILFTFKYSTVKHFFQDNYLSFLPEPDALAIQDNEKLRIYQTALMREFDKFVDIIDDVYNIVDVDKIGNDYLPYLIQLLGYEKNDDVFLKNASFRELAKNIIEIYRIKGTSYSLELFFNFLGLSVNVKEAWFDKRLYYATVKQNSLTNSSEDTDFFYYLTEKKPTEYIPDMTNPYQVMEDDLTEVKSHLLFKKRIDDGVPIATVLNEFTFFKTNHIQFSIRKIRTAETDTDLFDSDDMVLLNKYMDFLIPIYIKKTFIVELEGMEDELTFILSEDISGALTFISEVIEKGISAIDAMFEELQLLRLGDSGASLLDLERINSIYSDGNTYISNGYTDVSKFYYDELYMVTE